MSNNPQNLGTAPKEIFAKGSEFCFISMHSTQFSSGNNISVLEYSLYLS
jgi:hypothetical protein